MRKLLIAILTSFLSISPLLAQSVRQLYTSARQNEKAGNYTQAIRDYKSILDALGDDPADAEFHIAYLRPYTNLLLLMGAYADVEKILENPLYTSDVALSINRAAAVGYQEKYDEAFSLFESILAANPPEAYIPVIHQNIGFLALESRNYALAETNFRKAAARMTGKDLLLLNSNLALTLARKGDFKEAISLIKTSLDGLKKGGYPDRRDYIRCLRKMAEIYYLRGNKTKAAETFRKYFDDERQWLIDELKNMTQTERLNLWHSEKDLMARCFLLEDFAPEFLYEVALFRRQTSLLGRKDIDDIRNMLSVTPADVRKQLAPGEAAVEFISYTDPRGIGRYAALVLPKNGKVRFVRLFDTDFIHRDGTVSYKSLFDALKSDFPADKNILYTDTILADQVLMPLFDAAGKNTSRIYFAPEGILHFWGIENMPASRDMAPRMVRLSSTANLVENSHPRFDADSTRMLLVGGLNYSALPADTADDSYNHEAANRLIQYVGSTRVFSYLPGTRAEVDAIHDIIPRASIIYDAPEKNMKGDLPGFHIVHIATHGYSLNFGIRRRPEVLLDSLAYDQSLYASGLALSGANISSEFPGHEDGLLSAREICDLDLSDVDFVVLSACQTAQGDITDEGCAGLVRGLKNAGVKTVMASLWSVDDRSTMLFMQEFYRLVNQGLSKTEAYFGAQKNLKNYVHHTPVRKFSARSLSRKTQPYTITTTYELPYYWAPFILIDDL